MNGRTEGETLAKPLLLVSVWTSKMVKPKVPFKGIKFWIQMERKRMRE